MSFGFSVGDIIVVSTLARSVWGRFRDSSEQFNAIQTEVAGLYLALDEIANNISELQATDQQARCLPILIKGCRDVINDANQYIQKNETLGTEPSGLGSKTQKAWRKLKWDSTTVNALRDRMMANATYLNAFNTSLASQVSRKSSDKINGIAEDMQSLKLKQSQQEREAVLQWISPLNFAPQQCDLSARRQEGTGSWLLESREFQDWKRTDGATLVCQGMPGAGKTMLTSLVIDHLQQFSREESIATVYVYCDYRRQDEQTPFNLIASLVKQLLEYQSSIPENVLQVYERHHSEKTRPTFEEILGMAKPAMAHSSRVFIILDALDELGDAGRVRQSSFERLRPLQDLHHFNLMTTSRYIPSLTLEFHQPLCLDIQASQDDIRKYVQGHIPDLAKCVRNDLGLQQTIANSISDVVEGMFLLAQLHMDSLRDKTNSKSVKKALGILPKGSNALDLAYDSAIQRIESQMEGFRRLAKQLLGWLTFSERLMTVVEVQHALAIEPGTSEMDQDNLDDVHEMVSFCAGLVIVDQETQVIRLVHYTTQDYFRRNDDKFLASAQQDIAMSCLTYLLYDDFEDGWVKGGEKLGNRYQEHPFLKYSARHWAAHASVCGQQNVRELLISFAKNDRKVSSASQVMFRLEKEDKIISINHARKESSPFSAMHVLAYLGQEELISELLRHDFGADVEDATHITPLWLAAWRGHQAVVELLLLHTHVNVNSRAHLHRRCRNMTPLAVAAEFGHDGIVELLIDREDVDVNLSNQNGRSPLHLATDHGNRTVVEMLLRRKDIEINGRDYFGRTPLWCAASKGHEDIVTQLLKKETIEVNSKGGKGRSPVTGCTPLHVAATLGYETPTKKLLNHLGIDVNPRYSEGITPLALAVRSRNATIVKLLCAHPDVDLNPKDDRGLDMFALAAEWQDQRSEFMEEKKSERLTQEYEKCLEILRTAIETRSQHRAQSALPEPL